jgi:hypothetical protein
MDLASVGAFVEVLSHLSLCFSTQARDGAHSIEQFLLERNLGRIQREHRGQTGTHDVAFLRSGFVH